MFSSQGLILELDERGGRGEEKRRGEGERGKGREDERGRMDERTQNLLFLSHVSWTMPVTPAFGGWRQEDQELHFEAILSYETLPEEKKIIIIIILLVLFCLSQSLAQPGPKHILLKLLPEPLDCWDYK